MLVIACFMRKPRYFRIVRISFGLFVAWGYLTLLWLIVPSCSFSLFLDGFNIRTQAPLELIASYFLRFASVVPLYLEILNW